MTDREKQILEITRDLSDCLEYDIEDSSIVDSYDTACNLVNKGWVKLPEGAVVLTREEKQEYESLVKLFIYDKPIKNRVYEFIKDTKQQTRKETAREILGLYSLSDTFSSFQEKVAKQFGVEIKE